MNPELNPERPVAENPQQPVGIFEKINNAARTRLAIAGIALASAIGGAELSRSSEADAAAAPLTETPAFDPALEKVCVDAAMKRPRIVEARIRSAGYLPEQFYNFRGEYQPMPEACHGLYERDVDVKFLLENPKNNKQLIRVSRWSQVIGDDGYILRDQGVIGERSASKHSKKVQYRCTPGKGVTDAFVKQRHRVRYLPTGSFVAQKIHTSKLEIPKAYTKRPMVHADEGAVRGPC